MSFFVPQVSTRVAAQAPARNPYGPPSAAIEPTPEYIQQLRSMTHHKDLLVKSGFIIAQLSLSDVEGKKRCRRCNARCNKGGNKYKGDAQDGKKGNRNPRKHSAAYKPNPKPRSIPIVDLDDIQGDAKKDGNDRDDGKEDKDKKKPILKCRYHTGRVFNMHWNCCRTFASTPGCTFAPEHLTRTYTQKELLDRHQYHRTPPSTLVDLNPDPLISLSLTDAHTPSGPRQSRRAVAIDCEMGVAFDGESELIRLTLVDYFTAEILLDSLVFPAVGMSHFNTRYSGVSRQAMDEARRKGKCITGGVAAARQEVWRWVGPETIVVGHGVNNDLTSLRWIHPLVVDSMLLATAAKAEKEKREEEEEEERKKALALEEAKSIQETEVPDEDLISFESENENSKGKQKGKEDKAKKQKGSGLSLKNLTHDLLDRQIQVGKMGHDSLEDALAARDLVHWFVTQKCVELKAQNQNPAIMGFW
ncbi:hypothetical protein CGMCC3_g208 [Colletotrichum fructicola]|uniref:3'-5' exonuclease n=1 Tax=Colletotrichum fructicola (strain Nara gc5) TaxID=1213859 RepID=L2G0P0_COLFN|nr:uncharacterized protein CGMCC3_g208 [Colletotrichum fructicola]KAE9583806.1 hypothetical protein CGMCC3_g208 [Colletotrichum fructicola]KAF4414300.1 RNA exonuclease 3 [Colletotrichum fructicola]KAF4486137.1 RNA exonuclease 3 [Colletotrichum fructicola Nara gc5]KAF4893668.1 RNA exonuclease 3 [Colletotrichum fructicola]